MGHFENRLAHVMYDKRVSIAELAEKIGRHRNTIANLREGTPTVRLETLAAVADALGVSPWEIFVWVEDGKGEGE